MAASRRTHDGMPVVSLCLACETSSVVFPYGWDWSHFDERGFCRSVILMPGSLVRQYTADISTGSAFARMPSKLSHFLACGSGNFCRQSGAAAHRGRVPRERLKLFNEYFMAQAVRGDT